MNDAVPAGRAVTPSISAARSILIDIIRDRQAITPDGVRLTQIGAEFSKRTSVPFEPYMTAASLSDDRQLAPADRKMHTFIKRHCEDAIVLSSGEKSGNPLARLISHDVPPETPQLRDEDSIPRFKKSLWLAFVRPLPHKLKRYINLGERPGFTDVSESDVAEEGWIEVERTFIAGIPIDQPIQAHRVYAGMRRWCAEHKVPEASLTEAEVSSRHRPSVHDLIRIIESLPEPVAQAWNIPAAVLLYLSE